MSQGIGGINWTIIAMIILWGMPLTFFFMSIAASAYNRSRRVITQERKNGKIKRVLFDIATFKWLFIIEVNGKEVGLHRDQFEFLDP
jgi:cbb3-type cytochrome oxidase subunit 3